MADISVDMDGLPRGEFRIARVFSTTIRAFSSHLVGFTVIGSVFSIPALIWDYNFSLLNPFAISDVVPLWADLVSLLLEMLGILSYGIITHAAFQAIKGLPFRIGESVRHGLARALPVLAVALCIVIGGILGLILLIIPGLFFPQLGSSPSR